IRLRLELNGALNFGLGLAQRRWFPSDPNRRRLTASTGTENGWFAGRSIRDDLPQLRLAPCIMRMGFVNAHELLSAICSLARVFRDSDLCSSAIILGEERSLSQESYKIALSVNSICVGVNHSVKYGPRPIIYSVQSSYNNSDDKDALSYHSTSNGSAPDPQVNKTSKTPQRAEDGKEKAGDGNDMSTQENTISRSRWKELSNTRPPHLHNMLPVQFHLAVPAELRLQGFLASSWMGIKGGVEDAVGRNAPCLSLCSPYICLPYQQIFLGHSHDDEDEGPPPRLIANTEQMVRRLAVEEELEGV
ncbi:hypothetical protein Ancab_024710, partial [Ancistrocladus abbreviatus]